MLDLRDYSARRERKDYPDWLVFKVNCLYFCVVESFCTNHFSTGKHSFTHRLMCCHFIGLRGLPGQIGPKGDRGDRGETGPSGM